jgi:hypothetical protein
MKGKNERKKNRLYLTYRIAQIGRRVVLMALCALTGMVFAGGVMAADWILGSTILGTNSTGTTFYNGTVNTYLHGVLLGTNPTIIASGSNDATNLTGSIRGTTYVANIFSALGTVNGYGPADNYTLGSGATIKASTTGTAAQAPYTVSGPVLGIYTWSGSLGAASAVNAYAIFTTGNVTLTGNNQIDGTATATNFNIGGSGIFFNNNVTGNQAYTTAGSVFLTGGSSLTGSVDFAGKDGTFNLSDGSNVTGNIDTSVARTGTLVFENNSTVSGNVGGTAAIKEIQANGTGVVVINGTTNANTVNLNAAGIVALTGGINTSLADGTLGAVNFNNFDGTVQVGNNGGVTGNMTTSTNNNGTLTLVSGTQSVTGQIGSANKAIKTLNIGGTGIGGGIDTNVAVASTTTINGDIFATSTVLNNNGVTTDSELKLASGRNLTGTSITTTDANMGVLTLVGGTQTVTATVGAAGASLKTVNSGANGATSNLNTDVFAVNVNNTGIGTSNFATNVTATNINVNNGISNFTNNVTATTTTIGTGVGNFNTNGTGTTASNIVLTADRTQTTTPSTLGSATANLYTGLTGNIDFTSKDAVVNVWDGKTVTGSVTSTGAAVLDGTNGMLNFNGAGAITGDIGPAANTGISQLNINTAGPASKTVAANGDIWAESINLKNGGVLTLAATKNIVGTTATAVTGAQQSITTDVANTGTLTLLGGGHTVTGGVGSNATPIGTINAGAVGTDTLNNTAYAQTMNFTGNGTIVLNGQAGLRADGSAGTSANSTNAGLIGTVDFGDNTGTGTLNIGTGVNLTTGAGGINFRDANLSSLTFVGNSRVTGDVGSSANTNNNVFRTINAGANGSTVTFLNNVYVSNSTFHVTGTGTVNLLGNLTGPLNYDADGFVNVADAKVITGAVTTSANNTGTLNFVGGTTLQADIGTPVNMLKAVNFHAATSDIATAPITPGAVAVNIGQNVYATATTIGDAVTAANATTANITATSKYLGNSLTLAAANVTLNTAGAVAASAVSPVDFAHTKNADGTLTNTATVTKSTTGAGGITTNGATVNFAVGTAAYVAGGANGVISAAGSSSIAGSALAMNGTETVNASLLGSTRNGESYSLISVGGGAPAGPQAATLNDNSFVIDTALSRTAAGDLVLTTSRDANTYVTKSGTAGHFSNNAATALGRLSAAGTGYSADMQVVFNKLDIDQWGYGNNQANLAAQVKRLAPITNGSGTFTAFDATSNALYMVGERLSVLRGDSAMAGTDGDDRHFGTRTSGWVKLIGNTQTHSAIDNNNGYSADMYGPILGIDTKLYNGVIGLSGSFIASDIKQKDFRDGDHGDMKSFGIGLYGTQEFGAAYAEGTLGYAQHSLDNSRTTALGRIAKADITYKQLVAKLAGGYRIKLGDNGKSVLTPMLSAEYGNMQQDAYSETNAGALGLNVDSQTTDRIRGSLGMRYNTVMPVGTTTFYPELMMAVNTQNSMDTNVMASYAGDNSGSRFNTPGVNLPSTSYTLGGGLRVAITKAFEAEIGYRYEGSSDLSSHLGQLRGIWSF